jgi:hypothetical protein
VASQPDVVIGKGIMIRQINWSPLGTRTESPFLKPSEERSLKITFHTESFVNLSREQNEAVEQLRRLASLRSSKIESFDTVEGTLPFIKIGQIKDDTERIPVQIRVKNEDEARSYTSMIPRETLYKVVLGIAGRTGQYSDVDIICENLILPAAHKAIGSNILITASPWLLNNRTSGVIDEANPYSPIEASQIVGLFLRSRSNYEVWIPQKRMPLDSWFFYNAIVRYKLPNMWRYTAACAARDRETANLAYSILLRCGRVLQTRDTLGKYFYVPSSYQILEEMSYYFDYLTLLLAGAFDAQARIAHRACRACNPDDEYRADFRTRKKRRGGGYGTVPNNFLTTWANQDPKLPKLVSGAPFEDFAILLYELRNTVHGQLPSTSVQPTEDRGKISLIEVLPEHQVELKRAATQYSSMDDWGIIEKTYNLMVDSSTGRTERRTDFYIEPYTYACTLIRESFKWLDEIAAATDISGLLPSGYPIASLPSGPPPDKEIFGEDVGRHASYLGWVA